MTSQQPIEGIITSEQCIEKVTTGHFNRELVELALSTKDRIHATIVKDLELTEPLSSQDNVLGRATKLQLTVHAESLWSLLDTLIAPLLLNAVSVCESVGEVSTERDGLQDMVRKLKRLVFELGGVFGDEDEPPNPLVVVTDELKRESPQQRVVSDSEAGIVEQEGVKKEEDRKVLEMQQRILKLEKPNLLTKTFSAPQDTDLKRASLKLKPNIEVQTQESLELCSPTPSEDEILKQQQLEDIMRSLNIDNLQQDENIKLDDAKVGRFFQQLLDDQTEKIAAVISTMAQDKQISKEELVARGINVDQLAARGINVEDIIARMGEEVSLNSSDHVSGHVTGVLKRERSGTDRV